MLLQNMEDVDYEWVLNYIEETDTLDRLEVCSFYNNDLTVRCRYYFDKMADTELRKASDYFSIWGSGYEFNVVFHFYDFYYYQHRTFYDYIYCETKEGLYIGLEFWHKEEA